MEEWLQEVIAILSADTADLRELARICRANPRYFYRGASMEGIDISGQDIRGMEFTDLDLNRAKFDADTKFDQKQISPGQRTELVAPQRQTVGPAKTSPPSSVAHRRVKSLRLKRKKRITRLEIKDAISKVNKKRKALLPTYNVVRFRVKPGRDHELIEAHRRADLGPKGFRRGVLIKTGEHSYCFIGEWDNFNSLVRARPDLIDFLDRFRDCLDDLGGNLGITDPVSGDAVVELLPNASITRLRVPPAGKTGTKDGGKTRTKRSSRTRR